MAHKFVCPECNEELVIVRTRIEREVWHVNPETGGVGAWIEDFDNGAVFGVRTAVMCSRCGIEVNASIIHRSFTAPPYGVVLIDTEDAVSMRKEAHSETE